MQSFALVISIFFNLLFSGLVIYLFIRYRKLKNTFRYHKKMLRSIAKTINSVRYGNLYERVHKETFDVLPNLAQSVNSMIESIVDREDMIKEYQNDLNKKIDVLKEVEELKEDFVATLTHDLKVPILAEKNMLGFLLDNRFGELNDRQKEALLHLKNSNKELVELVEILLETYKLNETKIKLNVEETDVNRLIESAIQEMQPIADTDSINIRYWTEYDKRVKLDEFYIKRVLKNLILNAISFSNPSSTVDVALCNNDKNIYIKITNYGKSIKKEEIKHVFDKYYTTAKKFRKVGTGLGLYLSNKIVKSHKGRIFIETESDERQYTTFIIELAR